MRKVLYLNFIIILLTILCACGEEKTVTKTLIQTRYSTSYIPAQIQTRYSTSYLPAVIIPAQNQVPLAVSGINQSTNVWNTVLLNGSESSDADRDFIGYIWSFSSKPIKSIVTLNNPNTAYPSFIPDIVGDYVLSLTVTDGKSNSSPSILTVTVLPYVVSPTNSDPTGTISVTSATFDYWFQDSSQTKVLIKFNFITNDGLSHSFKMEYAAVDIDGNVIYSSYLNGAAPEYFQTSATIDTYKYSKISKWVITKIIKYT